MSEGDYGVALLNDCKDGHDIFGNVLRLSLLRAPPAPDAAADRGHPQFTYSLLPPADDFRPGECHPTSLRAQNIPLQIFAAEKCAGTRSKSQSFFETDRPGVVIEAVKKAERENALIVRFCEAHGIRGPMMLKTSLPLRVAFTCDLMERTIEPVEFADGAVKREPTPFEIITLKFPLT